ncbi:MAG: MBL fold metallo-hydrolase [bacterium]|nr:MBL fold metallo-hydrolase [bacterium]
MIEAAQIYESLILKNNTQTSYNRTSIRIAWLGTAGIYLWDDRSGILIDPYVSRHGIWRVLLGLPLKPKFSLIEDSIQRLGNSKPHAVIVSHSHFDHLSDAPYFAEKTGSMLVGAESSLNIGRSAGLPGDTLKQVTPGESMKIGNFKISFIESRHGPTVMGRVPYPGKIRTSPALPLSAGQFKPGKVFSILIEHPQGRIVHHGSPGFKKGMYDGIKADVLLLGIAGRGDTDRFLQETALKVDARLVIPIHFDNFFSPLEPKKRKLVERMQFHARPGINFSFLRKAKFYDFYTTAVKYRSLFAMRTLPVMESIHLLPPE